VGTGCHRGGSGAPETGKATVLPVGKTLRAGIVLQTGGADDRSFNAAAVAGLMRAAKDLGVGAKNVKYLESGGPADFKPNLSSLASQNYDIVFAVGYQLQGALAEVAPQFPNTKFAIIDAPAPEEPNCEGLLFREQEGSYLAGYLAASLSKTHHIGMIGGQRIPVLERFEAGYRAGARTADPKVNVTVTYTGDWMDESKGRSQAEQQFGSGVDIILQGAGKSGLGVIEAVRDRGPGYYVIGTDQDQDDLAPGRVLTTMLKRTDNAVFDTIRRVQSGQFQKGSISYGVKEGGIGLSDMRHTKQDVPPAVLAKLDQLNQMISDGRLVPPTNPAELQAFVAPKL
jgi:basic membrane protein A